MRAESEGESDERNVSNADRFPGGGDDFPDQTDFKIMMNYELGMHCTGFEFA